MRLHRRPWRHVLRDQIDPTIAAISTMMIGVTTVLLLLSRLLGKSREH